MQKEKTMVNLHDTGYPVADDFYYTEKGKGFSVISKHDGKEAMYCDTEEYAHELCLRWSFNKHA